MSHWSKQAIFYHIYPLGLCAAPRQNDFNATPQPRLEQIYAWLDHLQALGANALYLGPLFESGTHGYDTADYFQVDRRLGTNQTLQHLSQEVHRRGLRLILDGVFNHVGRDFWAFRDVLTHQQHSMFCGWFSGLSFNGRSRYGDPFTYHNWNGCDELVKLDLQNPWVQQHLFQAVATWIDEFDIDGLRLDTADCLDFDFLRKLSSFCRARRPDFWLMGEVIHGDYRRWVNADMLHSVTNYECYKGLWSSHVDHNYFEIAYALQRQFGENGLYRDLPLYAFVDNHDVNRVASNLTNPVHLYPLYCLLMSMPGIPSIYYGSEWGLAGKKEANSDWPLRPALDLTGVGQEKHQSDLADVIARLAQIRQTTPALQSGDYQQLLVTHEQFAFLRKTEQQAAIIAVNACAQPVTIELKLPLNHGTSLHNRLSPYESVQVRNGRLSATLMPGWGHIWISG